MNNTNTEARAVAETAQPVQFNFNEADVKAWLQAKVAEWKPMFPEARELNATINNFSVPMLSAYTGDQWESNHGHGNTFAEAAAALRTKLGTAESKAAALRVEAMALLARADELAPVGSIDSAATINTATAA